jgi:hypothetical protein
MFTEFLGKIVKSQIIDVSKYTKCSVLRFTIEKSTIISETDGYSDCIELQSTATWKDGASDKFNFNIVLELPVLLHYQNYTENNTKVAFKL